MAVYLIALISMHSNYVIICSIIRYIYHYAICMSGYEWLLDVLIQKVTYKPTLKL